MKNIFIISRKFFLMRCLLQRVIADLSAKNVVNLIRSSGAEETELRQKTAEMTIKDMGISFTVTQREIIS